MNAFKKASFAILFFAGAFFLEFKQKAAFGWSFDLILVTLLILPMFLDLAEFLFFGSVALFSLKIAYPWNGPEAAALFALPVLAFIFQKLFPWQSWLEPFAAVLLGVLGFYSLSGPSLLFGNLGFAALDILASMVFGWIIYWFMAKFTERRV